MRSMLSLRLCRKKCDGRRLVPPIALVVALSLLPCDGGAAGAGEDPAADSAFPLHAALQALRARDLSTAHRVLGRMARQQSATTLAEMQAEVGHGRALAPLFDELAAAIAAAPTEPRAWEMLVWCQSLWVDAMLSLDSLRVLEPDQLGAMLRAPPPEGSSANASAAGGEWQQVDLLNVVMSSDTGILSLTLADPVRLISGRPTTRDTDRTGSGVQNLQRFDQLHPEGVERVELGLGRKGSGMWSMHDEVTWADCQPDDALIPPFDALCSTATGSTWLGTRVDGGTGANDDRAAYILEAVEMALLRTRLGAGEARAPSPFLYQTWQVHGTISATWLQTWIATLPQTAKVPWRLASAASGPQATLGGARQAGGSEMPGSALGRDIQALRFYAGSLQRIVPALTAGRPYSKLRQEAVDATALAALKSIARCPGGVRKQFPGREFWWRPPVVTPAVSANDSTYGDCQWAIAAGTQVLEEAGQALEKPALGLRLRLLYLLFLRTQPGPGGTVDMRPQVACDSAAQPAEHNAKVFREHSTDFAGYMTEDISLARILVAYLSARGESPEDIASRAAGQWHHRPGVQQLVVDVGANGCELSIEMARVLGRNVLVAALEPMPPLGVYMPLACVRTA
jgi:hypothetical protein